MPVTQRVIGRLQCWESSRNYHGVVLEREPFAVVTPPVTSVCFDRDHLEARDRLAALEVDAGVGHVVAVQPNGLQASNPAADCRARSRRPDSPFSSNEPSLLGRTAPRRPSSGPSSRGAAVIRMPVTTPAGFASFEGDTRPRPSRL